MNIKNLQESLDYLVKAELTPFIWGHAGIGKSSVVKAYAKSKGFHFFPFYLGTQSDLGDILGLADFVRDENGTAVATTFATPKWLRDTIKYCEENPDSGAIIFLDEFNRARRDILNGMFSLALDKTFHTIKLPKNCHIIAAGNPPTDEYFTTDVNETALMARFVHIKLEPSVEEWVEYAKTIEIRSSLVGFIQAQPQLLEEARSQFVLPVKVDRRSFERLDKLFKIGTPESVVKNLMPGIIGLERTVAYELYLKETDKPLTAKEVLIEGRFDKIREWSQEGNVMSSYLNITRDNVKSYLSQDIVLSEVEQLNFVKFLQECPIDISYSCLHDLLKAQTESLKVMHNPDNPNSKVLFALICKAKGITVEAAQEKLDGLLGKISA